MVLEELQYGMGVIEAPTRTVKEVACLDRPGQGNHGEDSREATLFCAATLHRFGLPVDFARLNSDTLPET